MKPLLDPRWLLTALAFATLCACSSAPSPKQDTKPLRPAAEISKATATQTDAALAKEPELVRYASSLSRDQRSPRAFKGDSSKGKVTVYSKPTGEILLDSKPTGLNTPETAYIEAGEHLVQVRFEDGETSKAKSVNVRAGSRIKLFFNQDSAPESQPFPESQPAPETQPQGGSD